MLSSLIWGFLLIKIICAQDNLSIESPDGSGNFVDLIEFIEKGKLEISRLISSSPIQQKALMVMGLTGTGKSTMVNYLNGIPLVSLKVSGKWIISLYNESLPGGFAIGHTANSETLYPAFYTPKNEDFSYIDNPGFGDTRGIAVEIANGYLRQFITNEINQLKFLLLLSYSDLHVRGQQFRDTITAFSSFLGIFETMDLKMLHQSIGIIVSRVDNDGDSDEEMKKLIKDALTDILNRATCTQNEKFVFENIIKDNQIEIFSVLKKNGSLVGDEQKLQMLAMVKSLKYFNKADLKIRVRISENYLSQLLSYTGNRFDRFQEKFETFLNKSLDEYVQQERASSKNPKHVADIYETLSAVRKRGTETCAFETVFNYTLKILSRNYSEELVSAENVLNYFVEVLPEGNRKVLRIERRWLGNGLLNKLESLMDEQVEYLENTYPGFQRNVEDTLIKSLSSYYPRRIKAASSREDLKKLEVELSSLLAIVSLDNVTIGSLMPKLNSDFLTKNQSEEISKKSGEFEYFIGKLPVERQVSFKKAKKWKIDNFISLLKVMLNEITGYHVEIEPSYADGVFTFKGHFSNMSFINQKIKRMTNANLRSVRIYTTHAFVFNDNYEVDSNVKSHDLIVISPKVLSSNGKVSVTLASKTSPQYPDNQEKAKSGVGAGASGSDGKSGLPGFNGGNLLVLSQNSLQNIQLNAFLNGGLGGNGQAGGDGTDGTKGLTQLHSDYEKCYEQYKKGALKDHCKGYTYTYEEKEHPLYTEKAQYHKLAGEKGKPGGDAGRGGCGGRGGYAGKSHLVYKDESGKYVHVSSVGGSAGSNGANGASGKAGLGGATETAVVKKADLMPNRWGTLAGGKPSSVISEYTETGNAENGRPAYSCSGSPAHQVESKNSLYESETEYLKYMKEVDLKFKLSSWLHFDFVKEIIEEPFNKPELDLLIRRIEMFNGVQYNHLIMSLKNEIKDYYEKGRPSQEETLLLNYLLATMSSIQSRHSTIQQTALILDLGSYIKSTVTQIKKLNKLDVQVIRETYKNNFENNLKKKVIEANSLANLLQEDVTENEEAMNENIAQVLKELQEMKDDVQENAKKLLEKKEKLKKTLILKSIFSSIKVASQLLSFLGPKGQFIGSLAQTGVDIASGFALPKDSSASSKIPMNIDKAVSSFQSYLKKENDNQVKKIENDLKVLETYNEIELKIPVQRNETRVEIRIDKLPESVQKYEIKLKHAQYLLVNAAQNLNEADKKKQEAKVAEVKQKLKEAKEKGGNTNAALDKLPILMQTAKVAVDIHADITKTTNDIEKINQEIEKNADTYRALHKLEHKIEEFQSNMLQEVQEEINQLTKSLNGSSHASLDYKKWQAKRFLDDMKIELFGLIDTFDSKKELENTMSRIENSLDTMIDIYGRIENLVQQNEFANYVEAITRTSVHSSVPPSYQSLVSSLEKSILENIIYENYQQAVEAFKYWSFPFFCIYTREMDIEYVNRDKDSITHYTGILETLHQKIRSSEILLQPLITNYVQFFSFEKNIPFFRWSLKDYPYEVTRLLSGETTTLYADINEAKFDVVKFCTLYLTIEVKNSPEANSTLNKLLEPLYVELTHPGISNYKFKNNVYVINSNFSSEEKLLLRYQYSSTNSDNVNESYKKLAANRPVLSPYTFWELKLVPIIAENSRQIFKNILSTLKTSAGEVTISLCGKGQYVTENKHVVDCKMKRSIKTLIPNDLLCSNKTNHYSNIKKP